MSKNTRVYFLLITFLLFFNQSFSQQPALPPKDAPASIAAAGQGKISLDIKGMDIVDVLKMLASRSGMNVAVGKNVAGRVTLFLKDVNVWDAFEIVLLANDLAYEQKGEIINVITQRDYESIHGVPFQDRKQAKVIQLDYANATTLATSLNQMKTPLGKVVADESSHTIAIIDSPQMIAEMENFIRKADSPIQTRVFDLNYAQADKLSEKIKEALTKGVGSIKIDERTNKIAVTDYPHNLAEIEKVVRAFDEKTPQVLIDAQLIQINPSDKFEMGVDWDYWIQKYFDAKASLPINTSSTLFLGTATSTPTEPGDYKAVIDILRTIGDTKVLSSPRIIALNNQEAKIHVGSKEAYITSTTSQSGTGTTVTSQSVNFVDVGIQLYVTPTINRDGFVTMRIKPEISEATRTDIKSEDQITQVPIVSTSEAETTVMVKDGVTIIIGGLRKDKREKTVKKIPLLGDLPGVGLFFRSTSDHLTKTELIILLTPHIISGEHTYINFSELKPKYGAVAKMVKGDIVTEKMIEPGKEKANGYHRLISDKLKALTLFGQPEDRKGLVEVSFTLDSSGYLKGDPKVISASEDKLIEPTIESIKGAQPFPSFPKDFKKTEETFHMILEYS